LSSSITLILFVRGTGAREGGVLLFYQPSFGEFRHISVSTSMGLEDVQMLHAEGDQFSTQEKCERNVTFYTVED